MREEHTAPRVDYPRRVPLFDRAPSWWVLVGACLVLAACAKTLDGDDDGGGSGEGAAGSGTNGTGGQGGDTQCVGVSCGEPCYVSCEPPACGQHICDDNGVCMPALDVTCM